MITEIRREKIVTLSVGKIKLTFTQPLGSVSDYNVDFDVPDFRRLTPGDWKRINGFGRSTCKAVRNSWQ